MRCTSACEETACYVDICNPEHRLLIKRGATHFPVSQRWEYALQYTHSGPLTVTVYASDLPGYVTQASAGKRLP